MENETHIGKVIEKVDWESLDLDTAKSALKKLCDQVSVPDNKDEYVRRLKSAIQESGFPYHASVDADVSGDNSTYVVLTNHHSGDIIRL